MNSLNILHRVVIVNAPSWNYIQDQLREICFSFFTEIHPHAFIEENAWAYVEPPNNHHHAPSGVSYVRSPIIKATALTAWMKTNVSSLPPTFFLSPTTTTPEKDCPAWKVVGFTKRLYRRKEENRKLKSPLQMQAGISSF